MKKKYAAARTAATTMAMMKVGSTIGSPGA
jgi:hypothetical protein